MDRYYVINKKIFVVKYLLIILFYIPGIVVHRSFSELNSQYHSLTFLSLFLSDTSFTLRPRLRL